MALFNVSVWQRSRFTLQYFIINVVGSLACLTAVALAQFEWSEGVSGSAASIPDAAFTCIGNLAVFMTAFTRGRLDMENGARDVLATTRGPKLNAIDGCGLTTRTPDDLRRVDVVLLSKHNHSSLTQFMRYISHSHALDSILLQFFRLTTAPDTAEICQCDSRWKCRCVVFLATEEIMIMLADRLPGTLKWLRESQYLLPSPFCLRNGCHGCNQDLLYVEVLRDLEEAGESSELGTFERRLRRDNPREDSHAAAVCEALDEFLIEEEESSCICIPVHPRNADRWTKFMIKFLKSKEKEAKRIKVVVSDALQHYITPSAQELGFLSQTRTGSIVGSERYESASLILPRVAEVIVNMGLTWWLRVDGFTSSLVARWAIRDYVVDSTGTGFAANAFLTQALVCGSADGTNVCQVLYFRGGILRARRVSYMVGFVNVICSITWSMLIACFGNWAPSTPLSTLRLAFIIGAVGVALIMDCLDVYGAQVWAPARARARPRPRAWLRARPRPRPRPRAQVWLLVILEVGCIVSLVVSLSMKKGLGRWVYSGMQVLVWVKWGIGSFLLGDNAGEDEDRSRYYRIGNRGTWVYCSAFLLNAVLTGLLRKWAYDTTKEGM